MLLDTLLSPLRLPPAGGRRWLVLLPLLTSCTSATGLWSGECVGSGDQASWAYAMRMDLSDRGGSVIGTLEVTAHNVDGYGNDGMPSDGDADGTRGGKAVHLNVGVGIVNFTDFDSFDGTIVDDTLDGTWSVNGYGGTIDFACSLSR